MVMIVAKPSARMRMSSRRDSKRTSASGDLAATWGKPGASVLVIQVKSDIFTFYI